MNIEHNIIAHCAPTLAGMKTASLFTTKYDNHDMLHTYMQHLNAFFAHKGVSFMVLKQKADTALIYVYREPMLRRDLGDAHAQNILARYGYAHLTPAQALTRLVQRLNHYEEFPHEIGLFLGYPPADVEGFICNKGQNCNLCKYWKVYGNEEQALIQFARYDKCTAIYKKLWQQGRTILQLTVKKQGVA